MFRRLVALPVLACLLLAPAPARAAMPAIPPGPSANLPTDGYFGPTTREAVKRYQRLHGWSPTGIADRRLLFSLGIVGPGTLFPGCSGPAVRHLQVALKHHDRTYRAAGLWPRPPRPRPMATDLRPDPPHWHPLPQATPWQVTLTPSPAPTPAPVRPTAAPTPPPPAPMPAVPAGRPFFEGYGGAWLAPGPAVDPGTRFMGGGALWLGDVGLGGEYAMVPDLGGRLSGNMIDAQLRWRGLGPLWLGAGYRMVGSVSMGGGGLGLDLPVGVDWLRLRAMATGASDFGSAWAADGRAGFGLLVGPLTLEATYRLMAADGFTGMTGMGTAYAPQATAGLAF